MVYRLLEPESNWIQIQSAALKGLSHVQLLTRLRELVVRDHLHESELVAHLAEVDARRLYLGQACPSMFDYCVRVLHFAEGVAYKRIAVARAARKNPELVVALEQGDLHLTAASLIAPHLDRGCAAAWVAAAWHKTAREIKQWIADRKPRADVKTSVRRAPTRLSASASPSTASAAERLIPATRELESIAPAATTTVAVQETTERSKPSFEPLGANRYCVRLTINAAAHEELEELRSLLRHQIPDGDVAKIVEQAIHTLLEQARKRKRGASSPRIPTPTPSPVGAPPRRPSRKIPTATRRVVWERDGAQCSYQSPDGRRCGTRDFLEFHHHIPWARCREHRESNIHLRCRAHNQHAAELDFGAPFMDARRKGKGTVAGAAVVDCAANLEHQLDLNPVGKANTERGTGCKVAEIRSH